MKYRSALVVVIVALLGMVFEPIAAWAADADAQISSVREQWEKAWNAKDLETLIGLYTDDAVLIFNGKSVTGKENIKKQFSEINKSSSELNLKSEQSKVTVSDSGSFQHTVTRPTSVKLGSGAGLKLGEGTGMKIGSTPRKEQGKYSLVLKREKGKLLIAEHTWNETPA